MSVVVSEGDVVAAAAAVVGSTHTTRLIGDYYFYLMYEQ